MVFFKGAVGYIYSAGLNPIEVLLWSRGKKLEEVKGKLEKIKQNMENRVENNVKFFQPLFTIM